MSLYGVYGSHTVEACPVNNLENAKKLVSFAESDPTPLLSEYRINEVLGQCEPPISMRRVRGMSNCVTRSYELCTQKPPDPGSAGRWGDEG